MDKSANLRLVFHAEMTPETPASEAERRRENAGWFDGRMFALDRECFDLTTVADVKCCMRQHAEHIVSLGHLTMKEPGAVGKILRYASKLLGRKLTPPG